MVEGPKASQRSIIIYVIHFCIGQAKTDTGMVDFDLIFQKTSQECIGRCED